MKNLIFLTIFISHSIFADYKRANEIYKMKNITNKDQAISYELFRSKFFFSSTMYALKHIKNKNILNKRFSLHLEQLINKTGPLTFHKLVKTKRGVNNSSYQFLNGYFNFLLKNDKEVKISLNKVSPNSILKAESEYILGSTYIKDKNFTMAKSNFNSCIVTAGHLAQINKKKSSYKYYLNLKEMCQVNNARILFTNKKFSKSIEQYNKIDNRSYRWPYTILEKAWAYYYLKKYNRALGLLSSYKSPLLQSYFNPESEYLMALSYYKLCHYKDSLQHIENYLNIYKKESDRIKNIFIKRKHSMVFFFNFMLKPIKEFDHISPFMRIMMTQIRKSVRFNLELHYFKMLSSELDSLKKKPSDKFSKILINDLSKILNIRVKYFNHYIKKKIFTFLNNVHRFSFELINLKLNILTKSRILISHKLEKRAGHRFRGDKKYVIQEKGEKYWTFNNEFWADELGSYTFALDNNCLKGR